ncbi:unnamed protein product, partial [Amoebophrya sp. A25]
SVPGKAPEQSPVSGTSSRASSASSHKDRSGHDAAAHKWKSNDGAGQGVTALPLSTSDLDAAPNSATSSVETTHTAAGQSSGYPPAGGEHTGSWSRQLLDYAYRKGTAMTNTRSKGGGKSYTTAHAQAPYNRTKGSFGAVSGGYGGVPPTLVTGVSMFDPASHWFASGAHHSGAFALAPSSYEAFLQNYTAGHTGPTAAASEWDRINYEYYVKQHHQHYLAYCYNRGSTPVSLGAGAAGGLPGYRSLLGSPLAPPGLQHPGEAASLHAYAMLHSVAPPPGVESAGHRQKSDSPHDLLKKAASTLKEPDGSPREEGVFAESLTDPASGSTAFAPSKDRPSNEVGQSLVPGPASADSTKAGGVSSADHARLVVGPPPGLEGDPALASSVLDSEMEEINALVQEAEREQRVAKAKELEIKARRQEILNRAATRVARATTRTTSAAPRCEGSVAAAEETSRLHTGGKNFPDPDLMESSLARAFLFGGPEREDHDAAAATWSNSTVATEGPVTFPPTVTPLEPPGLLLVDDEHHTQMRDELKKTLSRGGHENLSRCPVPAVVSTSPGMVGHTVHTPKNSNNDSSMANMKRLLSVDTKALAASARAATWPSPAALLSAEDGIGGAHERNDLLGRAAPPATLSVSAVAGPEPEQGEKTRINLLPFLNSAACDEQAQSTAASIPSLLASPGATASTAG